jgi:hypothetical protein
MVDQEYCRELLIDRTTLPTIRKLTGIPTLIPMISDVSAPPFVITNIQAHIIQTGVQLWDPCSAKANTPKEARKVIYLINCFWRDWEKEWKPYARNAAVFYTVASAHQLLQSEYMSHMGGPSVAVRATRQRMIQMFQLGELRVVGEPLDGWTPSSLVM